MFFKVDQIARAQIGVSRYKLRAQVISAPAEVDCSSFVQWLYAQVEVSLPRLAREQYEFCSLHCSGREATQGDLVFTNTRDFRFTICPVLNIGHVGYVTSAKTVIHASYRAKGVTEETIESFFGQNCSVAIAGRINNL